MAELSSLVRRFVSIINIEKLPVWFCRVDAHRPGSLCKSICIPNGPRMLTWTMHKPMHTLCIRHSSSSSKSTPEFDSNDDDDDSIQRELKIEQMRNKSRLTIQHYNIQNNKKPFDEPMMWFHHSIKYKKRMVGKYGIDALRPNEPLGILWPTKDEIADRLEYERVARPDSLQSMMEQVSAKNRKIEEARNKRQEEVAIKYAKSEQWKKELNAKLEKQLIAANAAKLKKDRLMEEIRRHFGYKVDPKNPKFREMLVQKQEEEKRLAKEAKKKAKQENLMKRLLSKGKEKEKKNPDSKPVLQPDEPSS